MKCCQKAILLAISIVAPVLAYCDTAPLTPGDPWGGGIDFTCDDNPSSPGCRSCEDTTIDADAITEHSESFEPQKSGEGVEGSIGEFGKEGEIPSECVGDEEEPRCKISKNPKNYDKCVWSKTGPVCGKTSSGVQKCCEYPIGDDGKPNKKECRCLTERQAGSDNSKCADCLCLAEAADQKPRKGQDGAPGSANPDELLCKRLMHCVLHGDAKRLSPNDPESKFCDAALGVVKNSDSWRFSAARCVCDRSTGPGDERGKNGNGVAGYNQAFCDCVEGKRLDSESQAALDDCKKVRTSTDCAGYTFDHYARGSDISACPCAASRIRSIQVCGDHVFCDCR